MPIPRDRFESWSMDFITSMPAVDGYDAVFTCVDRLTKLVRLTPVKMEGLTAERVAHHFFARVIRDFGVPHSIVSDRDPRFVSEFWKALMSMLGTKL